MELSEIIPLDIMIDILLRLPAKPLIRFKCVNQSWYDLISDPDFAKHHLHRSLATQSNNHFIFRKPMLLMGDFDSFDNAIELNYPFKNRENGGASIIGYCQGLFCLWNFENQNFIVFLLNPTTRTYTILPYLPKPSHVSHLNHKFIYGFGYDCVEDDYKFVRILQCRSEDSSESYSELMVYSLKMDSWSKVLDHVPINFNCRRGDGVLVGENLHWVIDTENNEPLLPIVSFNLSTYSFGEIPIPEIDLDSYYRDMYVGVLEGCLCAIVNHLDDSEIFVMKKYGVVESWAKLFRVVTDTKIYNMERTIALINNRKTLLIRFASVKLASIDLETLEIKNLSAFGLPTRRLDAHVCVENLLMLDYLSDFLENEEEGEEDGGEEEEGEEDGGEEEEGEEDGGEEEQGAREYDG